jgi:putative ABC transport system permease protein
VSCVATGKRFVNDGRGRTLRSPVGIGKSSAGQSRILNGVLKDVVVMASLGLAIGVACGWLSSRLFESLLFGVTATDPATYLTMLAIVGGVALIASLLPAIRAARTEPMSALRLE